MENSYQSNQQPGNTRKLFLHWYLKFILFLTPLLILAHILYFLAMSTYLLFAVFDPYVHEGSIFIPFTYIFIAAFSALWIYATHYVANKFQIADQKFKPMHTMICFLIPGINCIYPPMTMLQIWKASDPETTRETWKHGSVSKTLIVNWFLFAIVNIMMIVALLKGFYLSNSENKIFTFSFLGTLLTIIIFMFKLYYRQSNKVKKLGLLEESSLQQSYHVDHAESYTTIKNEKNPQSPKIPEKNKKADQYGGYGDYHNSY